MYKSQQKGFTIVELVVVIVVIGILAAVALPRFLGLQDRAHDAVVEGTQSALASGVVMAKSVWLAEGRDSALDNIISKDVNGSTVSLDVNGNGFPVGHTANNTGTTANNVSSNAVCLETFEFLLSDNSVKATDDQDELTTGADSTFDFVATKVGSADATNTCEFTYLPDSDPTTRKITYDPVAGTVAVEGLSSTGTTSN